MALLYAAEIEEALLLRKRLKEHAPDIEIRIWPEIGCLTDIRFIVVPGAAPFDLQQFPNLCGVQSTWAGVNRLLSDDRIPLSIPLARMVAPEMTSAMAEYMSFHGLDIFRRGLEIREAQAKRHWLSFSSLVAKPKIGILGFGHLGKEVARKLLALGFKVTGWARGDQEFPGVLCYAGKDALPEFLAENEILVCLLPETEETKNILNAALFQELPKGASVILAGRGSQLVEQDLIEALDRNHLHRAIIDVFHSEPLPKDHPFWNHPRITITPHVAAISRPGMGLSLIIENYRRAIAGEKLLHEVDRRKGY